jgi:hypothetical protein
MIATCSYMDTSQGDTMTGSHMTGPNLGFDWTEVEHGWRAQPFEHADLLATRRGGRYRIALGAYGDTVAHGYGYCWAEAFNELLMVIKAHRDVMDGFLLAERGAP